MAYICKFVFNPSGSDGDTSDEDWIGIDDWSLESISFE